MNPRDVNIQIAARFGVISSAFLNDVIWLTRVGFYHWNTKTSGNKTCLTLSAALWLLVTTQIAKFMGPTWGPPGSCRPQIGPMLAPWTLLSGYLSLMAQHHRAFMGRTCLQPSFPGWELLPGVILLTSLWPHSGRATPSWVLSMPSVHCSRQF